MYLQCEIWVRQTKYRNKINGKVFYKNLHIQIQQHTYVFQIKDTNIWSICYSIWPFLWKKSKLCRTSFGKMKLHQKMISRSENCFVNNAKLSISNIQSQLISDTGNEESSDSIRICRQKGDSNQLPLTITSDTIACRDFIKGT